MGRSKNVSSDMTPHEIVNSFLFLTSECLDGLVELYEAIERPSVSAGQILRPRDGSAPVRAGRLPGLCAFKLHGCGCRFDHDSGAELDVDWDSDGRAVFDSWRILMFARSIGERSVGQQRLRAAAIETPAISPIGLDLFSWTDRRYDIRR